MLRSAAAALIAASSIHFFFRATRESTSTLVNTVRYPLAEEHSALAAARRSLAETGVASFPGFLTPEATAAAAAEAVAASPSAFVTDSTHNAWQSPRNATLPDEHVVNLFMPTRVASIAFDEIGSTLRALYDDDDVLAFLSSLLGKPLHRLADPLGACSINVFRERWSHAYHFDEAEYTVTLSLQQAEEGGDFVFTPPLRASDDDLAVDAVASVLRAHTGFRPALPPPPEPEPPGVSSGSATPPVNTAPFAPGTLQVFAGRYSLHAVTPTAGARERLVAVLCYAGEPGVRNSPAVQEMFWGRTA